MQIKKIMSILLVACLALSMFVGCSGDAENSNTTKAPEKATASSAATGKPTASPTEKPTPTPVPTENPHASYFDVDAIVTDFADGFDESYITISSVEAAYINADNPFVTIEQVGNCGEFTVPFGEFENVDVNPMKLRKHSRLRHRLNCKRLRQRTGFVSILPLVLIVKITL